MLKKPRMKRESSGVSCLRINSGSEPLRYLAISTMIDPDICEYPDSGKVGAYAGDGDGELAHLSRYTSTIDYWDGE